MPARRPRALTFSLLPPFCHLSLSSSSCPACCRGRRPPSSIPTLLVDSSPRLNSALPGECLQHRQIFSNAHVPLRPEQISAQPSAGSSADGIFGPFSCLPPYLGSPGGFSQLAVVWVRCIPRRSHSLGSCPGPLPCRPGGDRGACSALRALPQTGISTGTTAQLKSQGCVCSLGKALLPKAINNVPKFQHGEENLSDL